MHRMDASVKVVTEVNPKEPQLSAASVPLPRVLFLLPNGKGKYHGDGRRGADLRRR